MAIIGERPETGVRIAIERPRTGGPPWAYYGTAALPNATFPVQVAVSDGGEVDVVLAPSTDADAPAALPLGALPLSDLPLAPPPDLAETIRLIVRTAYRQAKSDDEAPAFRIVRWRADK